MGNDPEKIDLITAFLIAVAAAFIKIVSESPRPRPLQLLISFLTALFCGVISGLYVIDESWDRGVAALVISLCTMSGQAFVKAVANTDWKNIQKYIDQAITNWIDKKTK